MGSINLFQDLQTIFYLLTASMLLSAIGVGISGWQSRLLRGLLAAGMVFLVLSLPQFLMFLAFTGSVGAGGTGFRFGLLEFFMLVWLAVWLMLFFVSYGASVIAPVAENHSRHKRGIGLVVLLSLLLYSNLTGHAWVWVLSFVLVVPLLVDALCEPVKLIPSLYTPQRWMPAGIRWLFFPGWVTALFFTLLCMAILYAGTVYPGGMQDSIWIMMNLYSILVLPVALVLNLFPRVGKWIPAYMAFQLGAFITSVVLIAIHEITFRDWMDSFMRWVPHLAFFYLFDDANRADSETAVAVTAVFFLVTLGAMAAARKPFRMMLNLCRETRDMPGPDAV